MTPKHKLTEHNYDKMVATCVVCGPNTKFSMKNTGKYRTPLCNTVRNRWRRDKNRGGSWGTKHPEIKAAMIEAQNGICLICKNASADRLDHCHKTLKNRGVLCNKCNILLGMAGDSIEVLESAIEYLRNSVLTDPAR